MIRFIPGQQMKTFNIIRKKPRTDNKGRVSNAEKGVIGTLKGSISQASQREADRWNQQEHPISHTITVKGYTIADAEDILQLNDRNFYIHSKSNPGELNIYSVFYCEERNGA